MTTTLSATTRTVGARIRRLATQFTACPVALAVTWIVLLSWLVRIALFPITFVAESLVDDWFPPPLKGANLFKMIATGLILAPVLETFFNQWLVFRIAARVRLLPARPLLTITLSALTFCALHFYSVSYMVSTFGMGIVLGAAFWLRGAGRQPFWIVASAHAVLNGVAILIMITQK